MSDPGFPRGRQLPRGVHQPVILKNNFCRKLHVNERIWTERVGRASLAPPPGSATDLRLIAIINALHHCIMSVCQSVHKEVPMLPLGPSTLPTLLTWRPSPWTCVNLFTLEHIRYWQVGGWPSTIRLSCSFVPYGHKDLFSPQPLKIQKARRLKLYCVLHSKCIVIELLHEFTQVFWISEWK